SIQSARAGGVTRDVRAGEDAAAQRLDHQRADVDALQHASADPPRVTRRLALEHGAAVQRPHQQAPDGLGLAVHVQAVRRQASGHAEDAITAYDPLVTKFALFDWLDESGRGLGETYAERLEMLEYADEAG